MTIAGERLGDNWSGLSGQEQGWLRSLWGKSAGRAGGTTNLLLSHLLDTAAVAELVWDRYLAVSIRDRVAGLAGGVEQGRRLFVWLCGVHDLGKATPVFQAVDGDGARAVRQSGLGWDEFTVKGQRWRHELAGAAVLNDVLEDSGWSAAQRDWVWPMVAGHHGKFPTSGELRPRRQKQLRGTGDWPRAQRLLLECFTQAVGFTDLAAVEPLRMPSRSLQLQLSGFIVMADWIASNEEFFVGVDQLNDITIDEARERARNAWDRLGLARGWGVIEEPSVEDFRARFNASPRPSQRVAIECAARMASPGLMILEAPMGEGKTKTALMCAEVFAARFGFDGVYVGMPTQATSDPMFTTVRAWVEAIDEKAAHQVALLHGKRRFNKQWRQLTTDDQRADTAFASVGEDEFGLDDLYGTAEFDPCTCDRPERTVPAEWFLGAKRGLLAPFVVGTIDQLLLAATRTKHVMLRMAGLAGKVVILDEVHATDVYMSEFLVEGLRWLGQAGVPVILLSATLPPAQRSQLLDAYLSGAGDTQRVPPRTGDHRGYPRVTTAWVDSKSGPVIEEATADPWRSESLKVKVEVAEEATSIADVLADRLTEGGCVLVIRNTVARAQQTYRELRSVFGESVFLLHGQMNVRQRAEVADECLERLGPKKDGCLRESTIVVATQIAEQSFDVDADLLITDLVSMDLLLQRIGRMHRHDGVVRPPRLREPTVVITGFTPDGDGVPEFIAASEAIYGRYPLLRSAAAVLDAREGYWQIPAQVPALVAAAYDSNTAVPASWEPDVAEALLEWRDEQRLRAAMATRFVLTRLGEHARPTLEGLHRGAGDYVRDEDVRVRDGEEGIEVILIRRDEHAIRSENKHRLGPHGEVADEVLDHVLGGTLRLPPKLRRAAEKGLRPMDGWRDHPWLRYSRALELDGESRGQVGDTWVRYDDELGLVIE
ncbi:CRISPR-associated helicase/endonuclease Cas3 [Nocardia salmonicida]|uniref:CRISPR-associated helicase/endonuclease Cas3 n=1 Tax=Nocardia salmonicida TaxID=53431 RepID=UPI000A02E852|nr:CRISPR-associated helicase/endonuclease Cas3 [Nocardia salmonicida]